MKSEMPSRIRARLGAAGFSSDIMDLAVKRLSGGQKARLLLLLVVIEKPDLLILDEPTNHLDIESREALIIALNEYTGSLILVSHDAFLVERLVDRLLIVKDNSVSEFNGDIHEYRKLVLSKNNINKNKKNNNLSKDSNLKNEINLNLPDLQKQLKKSEKIISDLEKNKSLLDNEMLNKNFYNSENNKRVKEVNIELNKLLKLIEIEENEWEKIVNHIQLIKN